MRPPPFAARTGWDLSDNRLASALAEASQKVQDARASIDVTQYDSAGRELVRAELEAAVAG